MHTRFFSRKQYQTHGEHHGDFDPKGVGFKNDTHGDHVFLPPWTVFPLVGLMIGLGFLVGALVGNYSIVWTVGITSTVYYYLYQWVHSCMHIPADKRFTKSLTFLPKGVWFESSRLGRWLIAYHLSHHQHGMAEHHHFCLLCPVAEWVMHPGEFIAEVGWILRKWLMKGVDQKK